MYVCVVSAFRPFQTTTTKNTGARARRGRFSAKSACFLAAKQMDSSFRVRRVQIRRFSDHDDEEYHCTCASWTGVRAVDDEEVSDVLAVVLPLPEAVD